MLLEPRGGPRHPGQRLQSLRRGRGQEPSGGRRREGGREEPGQMVQGELHQ